MAKAKGKSKKELQTDQIAAAVRAGREVAVETVDFSDPNRPKTCLEVDFPIIPINQLAALEGNAGKPIYQMSKWWARRRSSVFRSMLLAAAMKAPEDESKAAKAVWDVYYADHQRRGALHHLNFADPFMGGGTTIVEGSRLGMQMFGCDLNPVAWFVVKNEMEHVDIEEVKRLLADIEAEVKPLIMPYYACEGPNGEKGRWFRCTGNKKINTTPTQSDFLGAEQSHSSPTDEDWEELPDIFDIFTVPWKERLHYRYEGPEIIYTFWAKHGPCQREGCGHRTPIMSSPVVAIKALSVAAWLDYDCRRCGVNFDVERHAARMAPDVALTVAPEEKPFAVMDEGSIFLLLDEKLTEIGRALGKVDERGQIAEDLRTQILGQLSMQVNYASLYSEALNDPLLRRTRVELEAAMSNAVEARKVVFELFQDLDGFRLDDYKAMGNPEEGMDALVRFIADAANAESETFTGRGDKLFAWINKDTRTEILLTTERELSLQKENVQLLGLDHPLVEAYLRKFRELPPEELGLCVQSPDGTEGVLAAWAVEARGDKGQVKRMIMTLGVDGEGRRHVAWERQPEKLWRAPVSNTNGRQADKKLAILRNNLEPMLQRELEHRGLDKVNRGFEAKLIAWIEVRG